MKINIQAQNFTLTKAIRSHITRRLGFALSARSEYISHIKVNLSDINGPRGGVDKRCQIMVVLPKLPDVVIEDKEVDLYVAIDRAVDRASRTVDRRLNRRRDMFRAGRRSKFITPDELNDTNHLTI